MSSFFVLAVVKVRLQTLNINQVNLQSMRSFIAALCANEDWQRLFCLTAFRDLEFPWSVLYCSLILSTR
jgi:hypothetical protein